MIDFVAGKFTSKENPFVHNVKRRTWIRVREVAGFAEETRKEEDFETGIVNAGQNNKFTGRSINLVVPHKSHGFSMFRSISGASSIGGSVVTLNRGFSDSSDDRQVRFACFFCLFCAVFSIIPKKIKNICINFFVCVSVICLRCCNVYTKLVVSVGKA